MYSGRPVEVGENVVAQKKPEHSDRGTEEFVPEPKRRKLEPVDESFVQNRLNPFQTDVLSYTKLLENSPPLNLKYPNGTLVPIMRAGREIIIKRMRATSSSSSSSPRTLSYYWVINSDGTEEQVFAGNTLGTGFYYVGSRQPVPKDAIFKHEFVNRYQKHYATNAKGDFVPVGTSCQLKITLKAKPNPTSQKPQSTEYYPSAAPSRIGLFAAVSQSSSAVEDNSYKARIEFILN